MHSTMPRASGYAAGLAALVLAMSPGGSASAQRPHTPRVTPEETGCSSDERRDALRAMQADVLGAAPAEIDSLSKAVQPGGRLEGWRLSHGYVVLDTAGAVALDNLEAPPPLPHLLLYEPSPESDPADWLDFDGPDDPYRLVGWAYTAPYTPGSAPPRRRCIAPGEWLVHEAGWHLKDGGMRLTPGAATEPPRPPGLDVHMWHPQVWDLHVWRGEQGVPDVAFANPRARPGGRKLPDDAFFYVTPQGKRRPAVP